MKVQGDLLQHNLFIAYRGHNSQNAPGSYDSRYIGLNLYYRLKERYKIDPFFAPICYGQGDNFLTNIDGIMSTIVAAIIVTSEGMCDRIVSFSEGSKEKYDVNKDDPLYRELKAIFTSEIIMNRSSMRKNANVFLINSSKNYSMVDDEKFRIVYESIASDFQNENGTNYINFNFDEIKGIVSRYFEENSEALYDDLRDRIESCIYNYEKKKDNSLFTNRFVRRIVKMGSATKAFEELVHIVYMTLLWDTQFADEEYIKEYLNYLTSDGSFDTTKLRKEIEQWVNEISAVGHLSSIKELYTEKFDDKSMSLKQVLDSDDYDSIMENFECFQRSMEIKNKSISDYGKALLSEINGGKNILVYSSSSSAAKFIMGLSGFTATKYNIYIAECRIKSGHPFKDGLAFRSTITNGSNKIIITDNTALQMIRKNKIDKVVLGACFVRIRDNILQEVVNTSGSEVIIDLANASNIPVFVVCRTNKVIPENYKDNNNLEDTIVNGFVVREKNSPDTYDLNYEAINDLSCIENGNVERGKIYFYEMDYERFKRYPNIFFVSENGTDNKELYDYFSIDINKDNRILENIDESSIVSKTLDSSYAYEKDFLCRIMGRVNFIPEILRFDDEKKTIEMKRVKGIRIFELFVALDEMNELDFINVQGIKETILNRCYNNQQILISELINWQKDTNLKISVYPKDKVVKMIIALYQSLLLYYPEANIAFNQEELEKEAKQFYNDYVGFSKQMSFSPFRDSTIKNMILECEDLEGYDQIETQEDLLLLIDVLRKKIIEDPDFIVNNRIYDLDFSAILNSVSKYDDYIGLFMHERSYSVQYQQETLRLIDEMNESEKREYDEALVVRYLRFGGRKRLYRLIAPSYHKIRFKYDDERFYFRILSSYVEKIVPGFYEQFPSLKALFSILATSENKNQSFDLHKFYSLHTNKKLQKAWIGTMGSKKKGYDLNNSR